MRTCCFALLLSLGLMGCEIMNFSGSDDDRRADLGKAFEIVLHQRVTLADTGLTLTFDQVTADSRCPADVLCVWEGEGVTRFLVQRGDAVPDTLTLTIPGHAPETYEDPNPVVHDGYAYTLQRLSPYPMQPSPDVPRHPYRALVKVEARP